MNRTETDTIREVFLRFWHEYAVFDIRNIDEGQVVASGTCSGKCYLLTLSDDLEVIDADIYW